MIVNPMNGSLPPPWTLLSRPQSLRKIINSRSSLGVTECSPPCGYTKPCPLYNRRNKIIIIKISIRNI